MSAPAELQRQFQDAILRDDVPPGLFHGEGRDEDGGFRIYLHAYRQRLIEGLRDNFPVLAAAMGDETFHELARAYIAEHPSPHRSIRWFGDQLTQWLVQNPDYLPHPALADVARMDWALRGAFDAADVLPLLPQDLSTLAPEAWPQQRFRLRPCVALVRMEWQIEPIWQALSADPHAATEAPPALPHHLLVWRTELHCQWRSLEAPEAAALACLAGGGSFADICELLAASQHEEPAAAAAGLLLTWITHGLLAR
ncbi:MAG: putative DNA-binding domain-containing protein [Rhodocyclaceae bacterium]|nr:putative DNA-binding domain-containing protein [Rhodocyclaceae bacterium]